ncbi:unnamed protein product [Enterobius vermicularis]|uniref:Uncharacterized protein n=1 Tax=Enterobius vermicularis TaxID=51028 RepID=A0A0N4USL3_ENTVE|nr:unnamed protein product [Enterobius vermicularis]
MAVECLLMREDIYMKLLKISEKTYGGEKLRHDALYQRLRSLPSFKGASLRIIVKEVDHITQQTPDLEGTKDEVAVVIILH